MAKITITPVNKRSIRNSLMSILQWEHNNARLTEVIDHNNGTMTIYANKNSYLKKLTDKLYAYGYAEV